MSFTQNIINKSLGISKNFIRNILFYKLYVRIHNIMLILNKSPALNLFFYLILILVQFIKMNRQTFVKKPEKMCLNDSKIISNLPITNANSFQHDSHETTDIISNLNTPQKQYYNFKTVGFLKDEITQIHTFSQQEKRKIIRVNSFYQNNSSECQRNTLKESISHFIDQLSSEHSDLSFRSDIEMDKNEALSPNTNFNKITFKYQSNLTTHQIKIFQKENQFKFSFQILVSQWIDQIFIQNSNTQTFDKQSENEKFQKFFTKLKNLSINHPFKEIDCNDYKGYQTYSSMMDKWIFDYTKNQKLILSFDFMFSHVMYIIVILFYWLQSENNIQNPLISNQELLKIKKNKISCQKNIINNLRSYICFRSRQIVYNPIIQKFLLQFDRHLTQKFFVDQTDMNINSDTYIYQLSYGCDKQCTLKETFHLGQTFNDVHLYQIYLKYQHKDKFIEENLEEQILLFCEIDRRNFVSTPINRYYQTGTQINTNKILAKHHTYLSCFFLNLTLKQSMIKMDIGIKYCRRFYELSKSLYGCKNYHRAVFFMNILFNIKLHLRSLWQKFSEIQLIQKNELVNDTILKIRKEIDKTPFIMLSEKQKNKNNNEIIIFEQNRLYKIINDIKMRYRQKQLISLDFHHQIQDFTSKILSYRNALQLRLLTKHSFEQNQQNKTIKMNLNYRFLNQDIYDILKKQNPDEIQMYENWKKRAQAFQSSQQGFFSKFF